MSTPTSLAGILFVIGVLACGSEAAQPTPAPNETPGTVARGGSEQTGAEQTASEAEPRPARGALLRIDDEGHLFALHRHSGGDWELGLWRGGDEHTVYLRSVDTDGIGEPRLTTSYEIGAQNEAILSLTPENPPRLVTALYDESGGELVVRTLGSGDLTRVGSIGEGDELYTTVTAGVHGAVSSADPFRGVAVWRGAEQTLGHHAIPDGHRTVVEAERRRFRATFFGGPVHTLAPWHSTDNSCGAGLSDGIVDGGGRGASWVVKDASPGCAATLHTAWFDHASVQRTSQQPVPPNLSHSLGMSAAADGAMVVLRRAQPESGEIVIGAVGFESSGEARAPLTTRIPASGFHAFPVIQCGARAWLPYVTTRDDNTPVLSTLELPLDGGAFSAPVQRWQSDTPVRCAEHSFFATSACAGG